MYFISNIVLMNIILNVSYIYIDIIVFIIFQCTFTCMFYVSLFRAIVYMYICIFIHLSIFWKSGTSDLMVLMLFVLQCTDYKYNFLTLTLMMLIDVSNKGSVPYCGSNDNISTGISLSEILFPFMLNKILPAMHVDWDPPHLSLVGCYILHLLIPLPCSIDNAISETKREKSCFRCKKNTWHVESNYILQHPKYLIIVVDQFIHI